MRPMTSPHGDRHLARKRRWWQWSGWLRQCGRNVGGGQEHRGHQVGKALAADVVVAAYPGGDEFHGAAHEREGRKLGVEWRRCGITETFLRHGRHGMGNRSGTG